VAWDTRIGIPDDGDETAVSPWAKSQPVTPTPVEFSWARDGDRGAEPSSGAAAAWSAPDAAPTMQTTPPEGTAPPDPAPPEAADRRRTALIAAAALLGLLGIVGALTTLGDDGDDAAGEPPASRPTVTEPGEDDELPTADPDSTDADTETSTSVLVVSDRSEPEDGPVGPAGENDGLEPEPTLGIWRNQTMEVPAALRDLGPMTLVAMSDDGTVREIDLPTGATRAIQLPRGAVQAELVAGSSSTLLSSYGASGSTLLRAGEQPIEVDLPDGRDQVRYVPGLDEYRSFVFPGDFESLEVLRVLSDGTVETSTSSVVGTSPWTQWVSPLGSTVVSDAGGVYELGPDGAATRISSGNFVAVSANHFLARECDETYECVFVLVDWQTRAETVVQLGDFTLTPYGYAIEISPDGSFVRSVTFGGVGNDTALIDLATGQGTELSGGTDNPNANLWAADSSGIFQTTGSVGIRFVDRTTGESTTFGEAFGRVQAVSVRPVSGASTPASLVAPDTGIALIGLATDGSIVEIDVDSGDIEITEAPELTGNAAAHIFPDAGGAVIASALDVPSIRFDRGGDGAARGARYMPTNGPSGTIVAGPLPNSSWQRRGDARQDEVFTLDLVDPLGREIGRTIVVDAQRDSPILGSDGAGRVLVEPVLGGVFVLDGSGVAARLTTGELIAIGSETAYVRECDEQLVCGVYRLDRSSGDRTPVINPALLAAAAAQSNIAPTGQSVSPDGDVALIGADDRAREATFLDTTTDSTVRTASVEVSTPVIWSADSRYAVFLSDDVLRLYDRASAALRTIDTVLDLQTIAEVPAADNAVAQPTLEF
jgi:hypothetical protein